MKLKNLPHLTIIVLSFLYSTYIVSEYLEYNINYVFACIVAFLLSVLAHYYLLHTVHETKVKKRLHESAIIALFLCSLIFFMEFNGIEKVSQKIIVDRSKVEQIETSIKDYNDKIHDLGTSKTWQSNTQRNTYETQIKGLRNDLKAANEELNKQVLKAEETTNQFRFFSIVFIILSIVASSCIDNENNDKTTENNELPTVKQPVNDNSFQPVNMELLTNDERIDLAAKYIQNYNKASHSELMKRFHINAKGCKEAKRLAYRKIGF